MGGSCPASCNCLNCRRERAAPAVVSKMPAPALSPELPVEPDQHMRQQAGFEMPPVGDQEFEPDNTVELCRAAYALAHDVPIDKIGQFWKRLRKLVTDLQEEDYMAARVSEGAVRRRVREVLMGEAHWDPTRMSRWESEFDAAADRGMKGKQRRRIVTPASSRKPGWDEDFTPVRHQGLPQDEPYVMRHDKLPNIMSDEDVIPDDAPVDDDLEGDDLPTSSKTDFPELGGKHGMGKGRDGVASWEEIMRDMGYRSPSSARQKAVYAQEKLNFLAKLYRDDPRAIENLRWEALGGYVDELLKADAIDAADAELLLDNPNIAYELDTYRVYLRKYLNRILPDHKELYNNWRKRQKSGEQGEVPLGLTSDDEDTSE